MSENSPSKLAMFAGAKALVVLADQYHQEANNAATAYGVRKLRKKAQEAMIHSSELFRIMDAPDLRESVRRLAAKWRLEASTSEELHGGLYLAANELEAFLAENKDLTPPQTEGREKGS